MRVRILSGGLAGQVIEQDRPEAESNIAMGFAEPAPAVPEEPVVAEPAPKAEVKSAKKQPVER